MATAQNVKVALQIMQEKLSKLPPDAFEDVERRSLLEDARNLVKDLERPEEVVFRQSFETHTYNFSIRLAVDLGLFHLLVQRCGRPIGSAELAALCGAQELLIGRLRPLKLNVRVMRVLTALDYAAESAACEYVMTELSRAATLPHLEAYIVHSYENAARVTNRMPEYFKVHGYNCPTDGKEGPFQFAQNTSLGYFDYLHQDPVKIKRFNLCMTGNKGSRRHWVDWYPVRERLLAGSDFSFDTDEIFLVDMGGGKGHHLEAMRSRLPELNGHLILQDLPGTIDSLTGLDPGIRAMVHDIFSPQPILGAKVYYTHFLLHDFPDDQCQTMLRHVARAMKPGHSRLVLNEIVIPTTGCPPFFAAADITMMACLAAMQRSQAQWTALVESVGLTVTKIWTSPDNGDFEGIIEAKLAEGALGSSLLGS